MKSNFILKKNSEVVVCIVEIGLHSERKKATLPSLLRSLENILEFSVKSTVETLFVIFPPEVYKVKNFESDF